MKHLTRRSAVAIALTMMFAPQVRAADAAIAAAQDTIASQLKAFQNDDGDAAYSHAAPNVKRIFPTVEQFMAMVTGAYAPVRRPSQFAMGRSERLSATTVLQEVLLTGPDGKNWKAVYMLELQPDGKFRITAVSLSSSTLPTA